MEELKKKELYNKLIQIAEKYRDAELPPWNELTEEGIVEVIMGACEKASSKRTIHLEPVSEVTEEAKRLLEELKEKINSKPITITESIDTTLKEADDPFYLNLTTIEPPHPGSD